MKTSVQILGMLLALLFAQAQAAELRVPEAFDVLIVNGSEYGASLKSNKTVALISGRNVVIVEYDQIFDAEFGDSHDRIRSAPIALVFEASSDAVLTLVDPKLKSNAEARQYAKAPTLQLRDAKQDPVTAQQLPVREINGMMFADNGSTPAIASVMPAIPAIPAAPAAGTQANTTQNAVPVAAPAPDALQMLSYWWQQASPEQRAAFLQRITR
jgi:uncharacterized protein